MAGKDHHQVALVLMLFGIPVPLREDHPGKATLARGTYLQLGDYHGLFGSSQSFSDRLLDWKILVSLVW